jgi:hypothetical protein
MQISESLPYQITAKPGVIYGLRGELLFSSCGQISELRNNIYRMSPISNFNKFCETVYVFLLSFFFFCWGCFVSFLSPLPYFEKIKVGLWDHVSVCACLCIPFIVARQRLGKSPFIFARQQLGKNHPIAARQRLGKNFPIVARQRLGKNPPIVASNGSIKIPLSLLGNDSVKRPLSLLGNGSVETLARYQIHTQQ